ncbi:hypothetical protein BDFB_014938, partial [Asbolus verrucosus]
EKEGQLPFLDVLVKRNGSDIDHEVYRKKTQTNRHLNAMFHHYSQQKRALIRTLIHRAETICEQFSLDKEMKYLETAIRKNGFSK